MVPNASVITGKCLLNVTQGSWTINVITARIRRMGKVMFSVCPHLGGGGQVRVQPGGGGVRSESSRGGGGQVRVPPGGSGQSSQGGGSGQSSRGGGGQVSPARGVGQSSRGGWVSPAGGGGGSASCTLLRAVCLLRSRRRTFLFIIRIWLMYRQEQFVLLYIRLENANKSFETTQRFRD